MRIIIAASAALFALFASAAAQEYLDAYKAYNAALERGDRAAAVDAAERAWRAAEKELGDDATTAVLAFNYLGLIAYSDVSRAEEPARRVDELLSSFGDDLPADDARAIVAWAAYANSEKRTRDARAFRKSLIDIDRDNPTPSFDLTRAWMSLTSTLFRAGNNRSAVAASERAEELLEAVEPEAARAKAEIYYFRSAARLLGDPSSRLAAIRSHEDIEFARTLLPSQPSLDDFDQLVVDAAAWDAALHAVARTRSFDIGSKYAADIPPIFKRSAERGACELNWDDRSPPDYPPKAGRRGYIGAVLIGFDVDEVGVSRAKILAEVPSPYFGEAALIAVERWRLKTPPPEKCRRDHVTQFVFAFP